MNDYISRQAALDLIENAGTWGWSESQLYDEISELTTADVRPVVYGEWVFAEDAVFRCSVCYRICHELDAPFCYCGADMRKEN